MNNEQIRQEAERRFPKEQGLDPETLWTIIHQRTAFGQGAEWALSQSSDKQQWVSVEKYEQLKKVFDSLLDAAEPLLFSEQHPDVNGAWKKSWREKAGIK